ncbi:MAG: Crp/Fnr family transcriptional regulator [Flavobacteriaceae bacterium]|nr:MAG: Crp/Fnr family transcriptional regulator [Flavobacteriaceae bacterium]
MREKLSDYYSVVFEPELLEEIIKVGTFKKLKENELLIDLGGRMNAIPLLLNGAIKIVREDKNGDEILLYFLERGDTCAISFASGLANVKSRVRAITEKESEIIFIPLEKLDEWLIKYKSWRNFVIDSYNVRMNEMMETIDTLAFMKMDQRLYKYLCDKAQILRETSLNTTHQEIAYDLNTSRVVVSRLLKQLEIDGKIKLFRNRVDVLVF